MSTNSTIGIMREDGIHAIYCHWDGYPSHNGKILLEHYASKEKVDELIALGNISSLGEAVAPPEGAEHSFDSPLKGATVAYHRDRGEEYRKPTRYLTAGDFRRDSRRNCAAYAYVYRDGEWLWCDLHRGKGMEGRFTKLTERVCKIG